MTVFLVVFATLAFIGLVFGIFNSHQAMLDLQVLNLTRQANGRRLIARANLRAQVARTVECLALVIVAVSALVDKPPAGTPAWRLFSVGMLSLVAFLIIGNCVADWWHRRQVLMKVYRRAEEPLEKIILDKDDGHKPPGPPVPPGPMAR